MYASIFGTVTTIFQQLYSTRARHREMIAQVREFLAINDVSPQLTERVVDYVNSTWSMNNATEDAVVRLCHLLPLPLTQFAMLCRRHC